ncbi:hypothetical protein NC652_014383 [Populus alba x Populus x berolinensis]|nr:hypothetical protein NC652_014383 [Populus alba x Populus x berolinensis]
MRAFSPSLKIKFIWRFQESIHCFARRHSASSSQTLTTANQLLHGFDKYKEKKNGHLFCICCYHHSWSDK